MEVIFFEIMTRHFWAVCLVFSAINCLMAERKLALATLTNPGQLEEARRHMRWFALVGVIPWLVMGWGVVFGGVPNVWHYFRPQDGNPHVIAWLASLFILSAAFAIWVFAADGARKTREYGLLAAVGMPWGKPPSETMIKLWAAIGPFFVLLWIFMATLMDAKVPK